MAEIFISYKSERRKAAEHLAAILRCHGFTVWFDYSLIKGRDFGHQIDAQVREAKALVVLWCTKAVKSRWVAEEVDLAHELGILIPLKIEPCELPVGFRRQDYIDLSNWDGAPRSPDLDKLIDALEERIGRSASFDRRALGDYEATWRRFGAQPLKSFALEAPLEAVQTRNGGGDAVPPAGNGPSPLAIAAKEWPGVRDSGDVTRLLRFEKHFPGTWYAEEAKELREKLEAAAAAEAAQREREARERAEAEAHARAEAEAAAKVKAAIAGETDRDKLYALWHRDAAAVAARFGELGFVRVPSQEDGKAVSLWLKPGSGESFKDFADGPEMLVVPAREFQMGSTGAEIAELVKVYGRDWPKNEGPQHRVTIPRPFAIGRYPVTFAEWDACVKAGGSSYKPEDSGWGRGDRPVINVSWDDAQLYLKWLRQTTGLDYRLPSEAEWEYAARAGTTGPFSFDGKISTDEVNYDGNYSFDGSAKGEYRAKTLPVKSFQPNPWGLYQVHGNVWEWVADGWHDSYKGKPGGLSADGGPWLPDKEDCPRVVRGGSWLSDPWYCRSAVRSGRVAGFRDFNAGFRVARTLTS
jgi:formylglycine-generating enzyme required for sulfatase activity